MSYRHEQRKATHDGSKYIPLTVEKQILTIRKDIENMGKQHSISEKELIYQAYKEIKHALGEEAMTLNNSCSGCLLTMKKLVKNNLKLYDKQPRVEVKPLVPKSTPKPLGAAPTYGELLKRFKAEANENLKKTINNGKQPTKTQLHEYFKIKS